MNTTEFLLSAAEAARRAQFLAALGKGGGTSYRKRRQAVPNAEQLARERRAKEVQQRRRQAERARSEAEWAAIRLRLAARRQELGLSVSAVARRAGVGDLLVWRLERGCRCRPQTLAKIAAALGLTAEGLRGGEEP